MWRRGSLSLCCCCWGWGWFRTCEVGVAVAVEEADDEREDTYDVLEEPVEEEA